MLRLSLGFKLTGECSPFHLLAHSALLVVTGATPGVRCGDREGTVPDRGAGGISRSTAARNTGNTGDVINSSFMQRRPRYSFSITQDARLLRVSGIAPTPHSPRSLEPEPTAALTSCGLLFRGLPRPLGLQEFQDRRGPARTVAGLGCWAAEARRRVWIRWNQLMHVNPNLQPE